MKKTLSFVVVLVLAALGYWKRGHLGSESPPPASTSTAREAHACVWVDGPAGNKVDIAPTLERIKHGIAVAHRNDGAVFLNLEGRLPKQPKGYYREYVHPTDGIAGPGAQRVILGAGSEIYYTADHYETFQHVVQR